MPRDHARVMRWLSKHLVMPKAQAVDCEQVRAHARDPLIDDQSPQGLVHPKPAKEVTDDFARPIRKRLLHLVESVAIAGEIRYDICDRVTHLCDLVT